MPAPTLAPAHAVAPVTVPITGSPVKALLGGSTVLALLAATQYVAARWTYAPTLGSPLFIPSSGYRHVVYMAVVIGSVSIGISLLFQPKYWRLGLIAAGVLAITWLSARGPVYMPFDIVTWTARYHKVMALRPSIERGWAVFTIAFLTTFTGGMATTNRRRSRVPSTAHGTARWGDGDTLRNHEGLLVGRLNDAPLRYRGDGHLVTVAPTRSGKGVSAIIPNLLTYPGSVVVVDPKGENARVTARRRSELGTEVVVFDPFGIVINDTSHVTGHFLDGLPTAAFNPVDLLNTTSLDIIDDARLLADMLVVVDGRETGEQAFWNEEARALLTGLLLYVATEVRQEHRTLTHLRTLLTLPPTLFNELLERMSASEAIDGLIARAAARLLQKADKERSGVISSAQSHTHFLDSRRIARVLHRSTLDLSQFKRQAMSLYLVLPPDRLESYHRWLRLMIATCLTTITRDPYIPRRSIVFFIDEFGHLGRMRPIEQYIGLVGGYGASLWLFLQDFSQIKATYAERWPTIVANADVLQTFGTNDWDTAEYISKMTGDATVFTESDNRSRGVSYGRHGTRQDGAASTRAERGRRLLLPDEVRRMPPTHQLLFVKHSDPILATKYHYALDRDAMFEGHFDTNPLFERDQ